MLPADDTTAATQTPIAASSLFRSSTARLAADVSLLVIGMGFATLTARWLGTEGKGVLSAIVLWSVLLLQFATLGLTEAAIVRVGHGVATLEEAASATLAALLPLSAIASAALVAVLALQVGLARPHAAMIATLAVMSLVASVIGGFAACMLIAEERITACSAIAVAAQATTLAVFGGLSAALGADLTIAMVSMLAGNMTSLVACFALLHRAGLRMLPRRNLVYLRSALRYGLRVQPAGILSSAAGRMDLALVYSIAGAAAAGSYSIALTYGTLVSAGAAAVSFAIFPRLARLSEREATTLIATTLRLVLLTGVVLGAAFALLAAPAIGMVFGHDYRPAITPAAILAIAGVPWSVQWITARGEGARDRPNVQLVSFAANAVVTLGSDLWLVGAHGLVGAAMGSLAGNFVGAAIALRMADISPRSLVPRSADVTELASMVRRSLHFVQRA